MARLVEIPDDLPAVKVPVAPTLEEWEALDPEERRRVAERLTLETDAALSEEAMRLGEGDVHQDAWSEAKETLRAYFGGRRRRALYIGANMSVIYPGQPGISPDLFAVCDVETHPRDSWMVHVEGKGIDLAMEFCKEGDRRKDFVTNVERFAGLGIREYFAIDLKRGFLRGWRLPSPVARRYQPVLTQGGRYYSEVLDLELAFTDGLLQFFSDNAVLQSRQGLIQFLSRQVDQERVRADEERVRAEEERARSCAAVAEALLLVLQVRGLPVSAEQRQRLQDCQDLAQLQRWLARAAAAGDTATLLTGG